MKTCETCAAWKPVPVELALGRREHGMCGGPLDVTCRDYTWDGTMIVELFLHPKEDVCDDWTALDSRG